MIQLNPSVRRTSRGRLLIIPKKKLSKKKLRRNQRRERLFIAVEDPAPNKTAVKEPTATEDDPTTKWVRSISIISEKKLLKKKLKRKQRRDTFFKTVNDPPTFAE